jgi:hypothetical protein
MQLAARMPPAAQRELVAVLSRPTPIQPKPGLRKCIGAGNVRLTPMSAQLNLFARRVSKIG